MLSVALAIIYCNLMSNVASHNIRSGQFFNFALIDRRSVMVKWLKHLLRVWETRDSNPS